MKVQSHVLNVPFFKMQLESLDICFCHFNVVPNKSYKKCFEKINVFFIVKLI
jgi:hypothetical protein